MKREMIQNPRAIHDVPGFNPARMNLPGFPRSASRTRLPINRAGNPIQRPTVVERSTVSPRKLLIAAMV
jgi:hypothetical protein